MPQSKSGTYSVYVDDRDRAERPTGLRTPSSASIRRPRNTTFPSDKRGANVRPMLGRQAAWGSESGTDRLAVTRIEGRRGAGAPLLLRASVRDAGHPTRTTTWIADGAMGGAIIKFDRSMTKMTTFEAAVLSSTSSTDKRKAPVGRPSRSEACFALFARRDADGIVTRADHSLCEGGIIDVTFSSPA